MEMITIIILRSLERIVGVLIGGGLAWLGYRLFLDVTAKADGSGKLVLPGGTAIHLTRVGPGIFFSLFGTAIVLMSFLKPVEFQQKSPTGGPLAGAENKTEIYSGAVSASIPAASNRQDLRNLRRNEIAVLNRLGAQLKPDLNPSDRTDVLVALPRIKLAIMETLWEKDWGDLPQFVQWVNSGDSVPPKELQLAADYFNSK